MDMLGISPATIGAGAAGTIFGFLTNIYNLWHERAVLKMNLSFKDGQMAREMQSPAVSYDRHVIVIAMMLWVGLLYVIFPFVSALCHLPVAIQYLQTHGGVVSMLFGNQSTKFQEATGFVISPYVQVLSTYLFTFYMGCRR